MSHYRFAGAFQKEIASLFILPLPITLTNKTSGRHPDEKLLDSLGIIPEIDIPYLKDIEPLSTSILIPSDVLQQSP